MQALFAGTQYALSTTNMWFNSQTRHHYKYIRMLQWRLKAQLRTVYRPTRRNDRFTIGKQTIVKL